VEGAQERIRGLAIWLGGELLSSEAVKALEHVRVQDAVGSQTGKLLCNESSGTLIERVGVRRASARLKLETPSSSAAVVCSHWIQLRGCHTQLTVGTLHRPRSPNEHSKLQMSTDRLSLRERVAPRTRPGLLYSTLMST
jgi:hypothetical protein